MKVIIRKFTIIVSVCAVLMVLVSINIIGCAKKNKKQHQSSFDAKKIAIVVSSAGKNDNGYNQSAIQGAEIVSKEFGYIYKIVEPTKGVSTKAKEARRLFIEVDADKDNQQPGYILTSVLKNTQIPVIEISKSLNEDVNNLQHIQTYSLASGATEITDLSEIHKYIRNTDEAKNTWNTIMEKLTNVKEKIAADSITITNASLGEKLSATKISSMTIK